MTSFNLTGRKVFVAGHRGMVGSALVRRLQEEDCELLTATRSELDLRNQEQVERWFKDAKPDVVVLAAAHVGGINANRSQPVDFLHDNLMIESNVIGSAFKADVSKLLFLGSSCIYPKHAPQPITESALLSGPLEPTNEWYAVAKIAGIKLCQAYRRQYGADYISAMPTNLYGPGDNYDLDSSHVIPALIRKAHEAKISGAAALQVWGSGTPRREFLHADDCSDGLVHLLKVYSDDEHVNVGSGQDIPIRDLAGIVAETVGFTGALEFDTTMPDGTPRKLMSPSRMRALGWTPKIGLREGLMDAYRAFLSQDEL